MKLGVVGSGMIVQEVLPYLRKWGWEPTALCCTARSEHTGRELCREYGIGELYTDYPEFLSKGSFDTVYIGTPNHLHYSLAAAAMGAGKHVLLEKPMAANLRQTEALISKALEKKCFLFEAVSTIYNPNFLKVREWLPRLGEIKLVNCNFSQFSSRYRAFRAGSIAPVFDREKCGGVLMDLQVYCLHYIAGLFNPNQANGSPVASGISSASSVFRDSRLPERYVTHPQHGSAAKFRLPPDSEKSSAFSVLRDSHLPERYVTHPQHGSAAKFRLPSDSDNSSASPVLPTASKANNCLEYKNVRGCVHYLANMENGVDLSGVVTLDYGSFKAVSTAAKDSGSQSFFMVQGTEGYILQQSTPNRCGKVVLKLNSGETESFFAEAEHRMEHEFRYFRNAMQNGTPDICLPALEQSRIVSMIMTAAREDAGIIFPCDAEDYGSV